MGAAAMNAKPSDWVQLSSRSLTASVDPLGAQLSTLRDADGRDLLWDGNPSFWSGRAPLLFPIVGALVDGCYRLDAKTYRLPRHGFARAKRFDLVHATHESATFRLRADAATLEVYPFQFELDVEFALVDASLTVTTRVRNLGRENMPASVGYHPAFRWPLPYDRDRGGHFIEFAENEAAHVRRLDAAGLLTPALHESPVLQRRLALNDGLFRDDVVIFEDLHSRHLIYGADSGPRLRITYPDAVYLGLWSKPGAPFVCIEPWHGIADPQGFCGDFRSKPGVFIVPPGEALATLLGIELEGP
jgi:galactose mutarotase-like enzyme